MGIKLIDLRNVSLNEKRYIDTESTEIRKNLEYTLQQMNI